MAISIAFFFIIIREQLPPPFLFLAVLESEKVHTFLSAFPFVLM